MSRKVELMDAAIGLMAEKGYHRTTVSDIVRTAGVAQGTFYLYFDSKKALFISLLEKFIVLIEEAMLATSLDLNTDTTVEELAARIREAFHQILVVYRDNAVLARIFLREARGLDPEFAGIWESSMARLAESGAAILDYAIALGVVPPQNTMVVAHCVVGMGERIAYYWLFQENDLELEEIVNAVARFEMLGISVAPTPEMERALGGEGSPSNG